jgi:hypothetical protein
MEKRFAPKTPRFEMRKTARDLITRATLTLEQIPLVPRLRDDRKYKYTLDMVKGDSRFPFRKTDPRILFYS